MSKKDKNKEIDLDLLDELNISEDDQFKTARELGYGDNARLDKEIESTFEGDYSSVSTYDPGKFVPIHHHTSQSLDFSEIDDLDIMSDDLSFDDDDDSSLEDYYDDLEEDKLMRMDSEYAFDGEGLDEESFFDSYTPDYSARDVSSRYTNYDNSIGIAKDFGSAFDSSMVDSVALDALKSGETLMISTADLKDVAEELEKNKIRNKGGELSEKNKETLEKLGVLRASESSVEEISTALFKASRVEPKGGFKSGKTYNDSDLNPAKLSRAMKGNVFAQRIQIDPSDKGIQSLLKKGTVNNVDLAKLASIGYLPARAIDSRRFNTTIRFNKKTNNLDVISSRRQVQYFGRSWISIASTHAINFALDSTYNLRQAMAASLSNFTNSKIISPLSRMVRKISDPVVRGVKKGYQFTKGKLSAAYRKVDKFIQSTRVAKFVNKHYYNAKFAVNNMIKAVGDWSGEKKLITKAFIERKRAIYEIGSSYMTEGRWDRFTSKIKLNTINLPRSVTNLGNKVFKKGNVTKALRYPARKAKAVKDAFLKKTGMKRVMDEFNLFKKAIMKKLQSMMVFLVKFALIAMAVIVTLNVIGQNMDDNSYVSHKTIEAALEREDFENSKMDIQRAINAIVQDTNDTFQTNINGAGVVGMASLFGAFYDTPIEDFMNDPSPTNVTEDDKVAMLKYIKSREFELIISNFSKLHVSSMESIYEYRSVEYEVSKDRAGQYGVDLTLLDVDSNIEKWDWYENHTVSSKLVKVFGDWYYEWTSPINGEKSRTHASQEECVDAKEYGGVYEYKNKKYGSYPEGKKIQIPEPTEEELEDPDYVAPKPRNVKIPKPGYDREIYIKKDLVKQQWIRDSSKATPSDEMNVKHSGKSEDDDKWVLVRDVDGIYRKDTRSYVTIPSEDVLRGLIEETDVHEYIQNKSNKDVDGEPDYGIMAFKDPNTEGVNYPIVRYPQSSANPIFKQNKHKEFEQRSIVPVKDSKLYVEIKYDRIFGPLIKSIKNFRANIDNMENENYTIKEENLSVLTNISVLITELEEGDYLDGRAPDWILDKEELSYTPVGYSEVVGSSMLQSHSDYLKEGAMDFLGSLVGGGFPVDPETHKYFKLNAPYGKRGYSNGNRHSGIDFGPRTPGNEGDPIYSVLPGVVKEMKTNGRNCNYSVGDVFAVCRGVPANLIVIQTPVPDIDGVVHMVDLQYQHFMIGWNNKIGTSSLKVGDVVSAGQVIGYMGNTGISTGIHLHFAAYINGEMLNPANFLKIPDASEIDYVTANLNPYKTGIEVKEALLSYAIGKNNGPVGTSAESILFDLTGFEGGFDSKEKYVKSFKDQSGAKPGESLLICSESSKIDSQKNIYYADDIPLSAPGQRFIKQATADSTKDGGAMTLDGKYLVRMPKSYGAVGTELTIKMNKKVNVIIAAHTERTDCQTGNGALIEFITTRDQVSTTVKGQGTYDAVDKFKGKIESITKVK